MRNERKAWEGGQRRGSESLIRNFLKCTLIRCLLSFLSSHISLSTVKKVARTGRACRVFAQRQFAAQRLKPRQQSDLVRATAPPLKLPLWRQNAPTRQKSRLPLGTTTPPTGNHMLQQSQLDPLREGTLKDTQCHDGSIRWDDAWRINHQIQEMTSMLCPTLTVTEPNRRPGFLGL